MDETSVKVTDWKIVSGMSWETPASDQLFKEKGKSISLDDSVWDLEEYTGKEYCEKVCVMLRGRLRVPKSGRYVLGAGADWLYRIGIDGKTVIDDGGCYPPSVTDHREIIRLTEGEHIVDIHFSRGQASAGMCFNLKPWDSDYDAFADLTKKTGKLRKELHGANAAPILSSRGTVNYDEKLRKLNFTLARTHDWALWNSGQRVVDTHFIFPLMHLDPKDPKNYFFAATDEIIRLAQEEVGMEIFYRLGTSIEHSGKVHFNAVPPADYEKYAEVLAGIVRHYTKGWANGFHYNIRYWEIWNEPEGIKNMWTAPFDTFVPFFVTVLKRLKSEFPEMQFGGPALCSLNIPLFTSLLNACKEAGIEPDFISWHSYATGPGGLISQPYAARRYLDEMGFPKTKLCINEWHYMPGFWNIFRDGCPPEEYRKGIEILQGIDSGVYNLAVLSGWQDSPLDLGMWYGAGWDSPAWGFRSLYKEFTKNYYSMELFGTFLKEYPVKCLSQGFKPFVLAATSEDGTKAGLLISDFKGFPETLEILVKGISAYSKVSALILDETRNNEDVPVSVKNEIITLKKAKSGSAAFLIQLEK